MGGLCCKRGREEKCIHGVGGGPKFTPFGRFCRRSENVVKMDLQVMSLNGVNWIHLFRYTEY